MQELLFVSVFYHNRRQCVGFSSGQWQHAGILWKGKRESVIYYKMSFFFGNLESYYLNLSLMYK